MALIIGVLLYFVFFTVCDVCCGLMLRRRRVATSWDRVEMVCLNCRKVTKTTAPSSPAA